MNKKWSYETLPRANKVVLIIYYKDEDGKEISVGSLSFDKDQEDMIKLWQKVVERLNKETSDKR